jgi:hypothetical protein
MTFTFASVVFLSLASVSWAAPFPNGTVPTTQTTFTGDGSPADGWPTIDKWATYATM